MSVTLLWPFGIIWTAWHYLWRILPIHRSEQPGSLADDSPPALREDIDSAGLQQPDQGSGPLFHRLYSGAIAGAETSPEQLIARLAADPNDVSPTRLARFRKTRGQKGELRVGDEFVVRMPGPWDGPIRVVDVQPTSFRFATRSGHLEAGQIEWRAWAADDCLHFAVESWSRAGDRLSAILHDTLRMAKEVQLYMWTSIVERIAREAGGKLVDGVRVETHRVDPDAFGARDTAALSQELARNS